MHIAIIVLAVALSVGLRLVIPVQAIAGGYDDLLFIRLAESLCRGDWLGPYDNLTLAKGIGYPAFLCASSWLGLPLRLAEHLLYLLACAVSALAIRDVSGSRSIATGAFVALALIPIFWGADLSRVIREDIYISLSLLVVSCAALAYVADADQPLRRRLPALVGLGVAAAGYWLTREETPWLYPAVGLLVLYWLVVRWRALRKSGLLFSRRGLTALTVLVVAPAAVAGGVILTVRMLNLSHYGVFRDNDFRQGPFAAAYGAISRIQYQTHRTIGPWLVSCSLIWLGLIALWSVLRRRTIDGLLVVSLAVTAAFATRILLVSFLNVTALRSDYHYLYVSPAAPFGILIVACAVATLWQQVKPTAA